MADVLIIAIETATSCGGAALTRGGRTDGTVLAEISLQPEISHSRRLLGSIQQVLAATGIGWPEVDAVAVSLGPGSFTGLRIGMAAAQGLALATGLPLLGVPTLDGLAAQVTAADLPLCCLLDARRGQVYCGWYRRVDDRWQPEGGARALSPGLLVAELDRPTLVAGPGILAATAHLSACPMARLVPQAALHPRAAMIGLLAAEQLVTGNRDSLSPLVPLYVRASEAELDLKRPQRENQPC